MSNILVDPIVVIAPPDGALKKDIADWIDNFNLWLTEVITSPHSWFHCMEMTLNLLGYDQLPSFDLLRAWQNKYRSDGLEIDILQVMNNVDNFLFNEQFELGNKLEDHLMQLGYVIEAKSHSIIIRPPQLTNRWPDSIRNEMFMLLAKACACKHKADTFTGELFIATLTLGGIKKEIEISAEVLFLSDIEEETDQKISEILPLLFTPDDLPPPTDILHLWDRGEQGVRYAINQWYRQDWQSLRQQALKYRFSSSFFESITQNRIDTQELVLMKIVRAAAAIIADRAQDVKHYNLRQLRENRTADSRQRMRSDDNAKAWRLTITSDGVGWRMHYWQVPTSEGSIIEFANVLKKHDPEEIY